jgi:tetratricopeptide (TPR) repeat protein
MHFRLARVQWLAAALVSLLAVSAVASRAAATAPKPATAAPKPAAAAPKSGATTRAASHTPRPDTAHQLETAKSARQLEELGAYAAAAATLRALRRVAPPDADLDLALAMDLARSGARDSAAMLLWTPRMDAALADTLPITRRHAYPWEREALWVNGRFDGWHWYVARVRAELAASLARWSDARKAAEDCVRAHPLSGKEWLLLAVCAGREGRSDQAALAAREAVALDPTLPEAFYLCGLYDWRDGNLALARQRFRAAVDLDSTWVVPAEAYVRTRLPGAPPDSLPTAVLVGQRAAALLCSPVRPKVDEYLQVDETAEVERRGSPQVPESVMAQLGTLELALPVLVDEQGRAVLNDLPWFPPQAMPPSVVSALVRCLTDWRFRPAMKNGLPFPVWASVEFSYTYSPGGATPPGTKP